MTFARHLCKTAAISALSLILAAITLPLWLPIWLWISVSDWIATERFYWECDQREAERKARAALKQAESA